MSEIDNRPATLIGDILYWPMKSNYIIAFDNVTRDLYYVECPRETHDIFRRNLHIIKGHNGGVGLVVVRGFTLQTCCSVRSSIVNHAWTPHRNVDLTTLLALDTSFPYLWNYVVKILCAFEDKYIMVVRAKEGVFQLDISTMLWKKLC